MMKVPRPLALLVLLLSLSLAQQTKTNCTVKVTDAGQTVALSFILPTPGSTAGVGDGDEGSQDCPLSLTKAKVNRPRVTFTLDK